MAMTDSEPKWYILHTYSGYESMVKDSLLRLIENNNLSDSIVDVKIPTEQTIEEKANGKKKVVERKLLPCYVFIKMVYSNQLWYLVTNTRGVTGFCGPQGRPIPMREDEIRRMRLEEYVSDADFKVGDKVAIDNGPLEGFEGTVVELNDELLKNILFGRFFRADVMGGWKDKRIYLIPNNEFLQEKFTVRGDNSDALTLPDTAQILY